MRPLLPSEITKFLDRFDHFKDSEIRSLNIISPTEIELTLTAQDKARAFDWVSINFLFTQITDAKLINGSQIAYINLDDGINIITGDGFFAFCLENYTTLDSIKESSFYIISKSIKYNEGVF